MGVQECGAWVGSFWGCWWSCAFGHGAWVVLASALLGLSGLFAVPRLLWRSEPFSRLLRLLAGLNYIFMLALATGVHFDACFSHSTLVFSASWFLRHEAQNLGFMTFGSGDLGGVDGGGLVFTAQVSTMMIRFRGWESVMGLSCCSVGTVIQHSAIVYFFC